MPFTKEYKDNSVVERCEDENSDEERPENSSDTEDSSSHSNELKSKKTSTKIPDEKCPYNNSAFVYYCSNRYSFNCRNPCCPSTRNQCAGSCCYPRCCPCYNEHFKCCLPGIINRPQHYSIIPVKKCPPQTYVPNKLYPNGKWKHKNKKTKGQKELLSEKVKDEVADEVLKKVLGELAEGLAENAEREVGERVESPKKSPGPLKSSLPHREQGTEIEEPYFCTGATTTQTSTPLIKLLDRRKDVMVDTPTPIPPPCLRVLLRRVLEAKCAAAGYGSTKRMENCNFGELCKCTLPYEQREIIEEGGFLGDTLGTGVLECPCSTRGCRGFCGYQPDGRRILGTSSVPRRVPCMPNCEYYNIESNAGDTELMTFI